MYNSKNAIVTAGKTRPVRGTKIEGKNEAAIVNFPNNLDNPLNRAYFKIRRIFEILKIINTTPV